MPPPKVPEPAPVAEAILVERLARRAAEEGRPVHGARIDAERIAADAVAVAVPGEPHLRHPPEPAGADQFARLNDLRHAALLRPDLHDRACSAACAASTTRPSAMVCVRGFSTYTSLPAARASTVIGTCQ